MHILLLMVLNYRKRFFWTITGQIWIQIMILGPTFFFDNYDISQNESHPTLKLSNQNMSEILQLNVPIFLFCQNPPKNIEVNQDMAKTNILDDPDPTPDPQSNF